MYYICVYIYIYLWKYLAYSVVKKVGFKGQVSQDRAQQVPIHVPSPKNEQFRKSGLFSLHFEMQKVLKLFRVLEAQGFSHDGEKSPTKSWRLWPCHSFV